MRTSQLIQIFDHPLYNVNIFTQTNKVCRRDSLFNSLSDVKRLAHVHAQWYYAPYYLLTVIL